MLDNTMFRNPKCLLCGVLLVVVLAATLLLPACQRPEPLPVQTVCGLQVDTNNLREVWVCETEDFQVTLKFFAEGDITYSSVRQNAPLSYQLIFADSVIYGYYIGSIDSILHITNIYHDDIIESANLPFAMHRVAPDTLELEYIGLADETQPVLKSYKFLTTPISTPTADR